MSNNKLIMKKASSTMLLSSSVFESAKEKLLMVSVASERRQEEQGDGDDTSKKEDARDPFPLDALPKQVDDPTWYDLRKEYRLTLAELSCLKNYAVAAAETSSSLGNNSDVDVIHLLEEAKGSSLDVSDIEHAFLDHKEFVDCIVNVRGVNGNAGDDDPIESRRQLARALWERIRVKVKTKTRELLMLSHNRHDIQSSELRTFVRGNYLFGDTCPMVASTGRGASAGAAMASPGTELQFAFLGTSIYCAKVSIRDAAALKREYETSRIIHENQRCETVMPVYDFISLPDGNGNDDKDELGDAYIENGNDNGSTNINIICHQQPERVAIVTPYYPVSLSQFAGGGNKLRLHEEGCINVALCGLATIKAFSAKSICHGDVKPSNMMLAGGCKCYSTENNYGKRNNNLVVTIDFGSAVPYGERLTSITAEYALDHPCDVGSITYDLTCLASSISVLVIDGWSEVPPYHTRRELISSIDERIQTDPRPSLQIAKCCLERTDIDLIWESAKSYVDAAAMSSTSILEKDHWGLSPVLDRSLIVSFDAIWPTSTASSLLYQPRFNNGGVF